MRKGEQKIIKEEDQEEKMKKEGITTNESSSTVSRRIMERIPSVEVGNCCGCNDDCGCRNGWTGCTCGDSCRCHDTMYCGNASLVMDSLPSTDKEGSSGSSSSRGGGGGCCGSAAVAASVPMKKNPDQALSSSSTSLLNNNSNKNSNDDENGYHLDDPLRPPPLDGNKNDENIKKTMGRIELVVGGMTCSMCSQAIVNVVSSSIPNVTNVTVSLSTDVVKVDYDEQQQHDNDSKMVEILKDTIESIGYNVLEVMVPTTTTTTTKMMDNKNDMDRIEMVVGGMTCTMCSQSIINAVTQNVRGIQKVTVDLSTDVVSMDYFVIHNNNIQIDEENPLDHNNNNNNDRSIMEHQIQDTIQDIGYTVEEILPPSFPWRKKVDQQQQGNKDNDYDRISSGDDGIIHLLLLRQLRRKLQKLLLQQEQQRHPWNHKIDGIVSTNDNFRKCCKRNMHFWEV